MKSKYLRNCGISEFVIKEYGVIEYPHVGQIYYPYKQPDGTNQYVVVDNYNNDCFLQSKSTPYFSRKVPHLI